MNKIPQKTGAVFAENSTRKGMTLVEVLVAIIILAILAILATTALFYPTRLVVSDARRQVALHEAGREMELAKAENYGSLSGTNYPITALYKTLNLNRAVVTNAGFTEITVAVTDGAGDMIVELITVQTP